VLKHVLMAPKNMREGYLRCIAISGDGRLIASCDSDIIKVWLADTGTLVFKMTNKLGFRKMDLNHEGTLLVSTCSKNYELRCKTYLWDLSNLENPKVLQKWDDGPSEYDKGTLKFSPDGQKIAYVPKVMVDSGIVVWSVQTGDELLRFQSPMTSLCLLAWSPDSQLIAAAANRGKVVHTHIWNAATGVQLNQPLRGHEASIMYVSFGTTRDSLVSASSDGLIMIRDLRHCNEKFYKLELCSSRVRVMSLSPNQRFVASTSGRCLQVWDLDKLKVVKVLEGHSGDVEFIAWSPDGGYILDADEHGSVRVWSVDEQVRGTAGIMHVYVYIFICIYTSVCFYFQYARACTFQQAYAYVYVTLCIYKYTYVCMHVCIYIYIYIYIYIEREREREREPHMYACMYVCTCIANRTNGRVRVGHALRMCVYVYVCVYIYRANGRVREVHWLRMCLCVYVCVCMYV
jgi:WD40 repeat protein